MKKLESDSAALVTTRKYLDEVEARLQNTAFVSLLSAPKVPADV